MNTENFDDTFFQNLAHLFYAVANADRMITVEEKKSIIHIIEEQSTILPQLPNNAETIYQSLRTLIEDHMSSNDAFAHFSEYANLHPDLFSEAVVKKILVDCHSIAATTSGKNKSELILLGKLTILLSSLHEKK